MHTSEIGAAQAFESADKASDSETKASESDNTASDANTKAFESADKASDSENKAFESGTTASGSATKAFDCSLFGLGGSEAISCCSMLVPELLMLHVGKEPERKLERCRRSGQAESPHAY